MPIMLFTVCCLSKHNAKKSYSNIRINRLRSIRVKFGDSFFPQCIDISFIEEEIIPLTLFKTYLCMLQEISGLVCCILSLFSTPNSPFFFSKHLKTSEQDQIYITAAQFKNMSCAFFACWCYNQKGQ